MARVMKDSGIVWIGKIPEEWEIKKLKYCSTFIQDKYSDEYGDLPYIGLENIVSWNGKYVVTDSQYDKSQSLMFATNDILWGKLRPYLAKVYHAKEQGCCSSEFCIIRPDKQFSIRYFWNLVISSEFVATVDQSTYGTKMPRANADFIKNIPIPVPPIEEQDRIADFLDTECARIDAVIEQTRASIEEYKKLKQAVITQAVTKGIRTNRPMKDSGIEWIAQIPDNWSVLRGKCLFHETDERSEDGSEELLTVSHITGVTPRSQKNVNMFMAESLVGYKICKVNDIAANTMWMWQGAIGVSKYHGVISPSYNTYRQTNNHYDPDYLDYLLRIRPMVDTYNANSTGITASRLRLYPDRFLSIMFPIPPMQEQIEIAEYLNEKIGDVERLIDKKEQYLSELEKYKKSLIFEFVTGKKEV